MPYRPEHEPVYQAAREFAERCLVGDKSLLWPDRNAWTGVNVSEVKRRHVDTPLAGEGTFDELLLVQMAGAPPEQWAVLCDTYFVYYLPAANIKPATKQRKIEQLRLQGGLPAPTAEVWNTPSGGFTRIGQRYNLKHLQFRLILLLAEHVKQAGNARELLANAQRLQQLLDQLLEAIPEPALRARDMRHALLYMLFPDQFEPIIDSSAKTSILEVFKARVPGQLPADQDQALRAIRDVLAAEYDRNGQPFRFFDSPIREQWRPSGPQLDPAPRPEPLPSSPAPEVSPRQLDAEHPDTARVLSVLAHTRNIILYGPPGTGKTYLAGQVAEALIAPQLQQALPEPARIQQVIEGLTLYEVLAIVLYWPAEMQACPWLSY
jgi:hypothetical protein